MANQENNPQGTNSTNLFQILTSDEGEAQFTQIISTADPTQIDCIVSLITVPVHFMSIIKTKNGSTRVQRLLGISPEADGYFYVGILRCFLDIMTDVHAFHVVTRAMAVFDPERKMALYWLTTHCSLHIACNHCGCRVLPQIIKDSDHIEYKNRLLDAVTRNALYLSRHIFGSFAVAEVLSFHDLRTTHNVAVSLRGHCVELCATKTGGHIVEKLLEGTMVTMTVVVIELLNCEGGTLMELARSEFGNLVVAKALGVTHEMRRFDLFGGLVNKLMPFRGYFVHSVYGSNVGRILDSTILPSRY